MTCIDTTLTPCHRPLPPLPGNPNIPPPPITQRQSVLVTSSSSSRIRSRSPEPYQTPQTVNYDSGSVSSLSLPLHTFLLFISPGFSPSVSLLPLSLLWSLKPCASASLHPHKLHLLTPSSQAPPPHSLLTSSTSLTPSLLTSSTSFTPSSQALLPSLPHKLYLPHSPLTISTSLTPPSRAPPPSLPPHKLHLPHSLPPHKLHLPHSLLTSSTSLAPSSHAPPPSLPCSCQLYHHLLAHTSI